VFGNWLHAEELAEVVAVRGPRRPAAILLRAHRAGLERLRSVHGAPRQVRSMPDMLALDADYRERFGGSRLRPAAIRMAVPAALATCAFMLSLVLLVASFR
jgi:hypothetical protein